jgi:DNA-binding transcriptional ArsR family regulator
MEIKDVIKALGALAQENRLAIYRLLVQAGAGGRTVGEIADKLDMANATLSFHLKELANAGLIEPRQDGRFIFYSANYSRMNALLAFLTENCCGDESCASVCDTECTPTRSAKPVTAKPASRSPLVKRRASARSR